MLRTPQLKSSWQKKMVAKSLKKTTKDHEKELRELKDSASRVFYIILNIDIYIL